MGEDVRDNHPDVIGNDEITPVDQRNAPRYAQEGKGAARADADGNAGMVSR